MSAYCFRCRAKREISNPQQVTLKNGRLATRGVCPNCGTKVFRMEKSRPSLEDQVLSYLLKVDKG